MDYDVGMASTMGNYVIFQHKTSCRLRNDDDDIEVCTARSTTRYYKAIYYSQTSTEMDETSYTVHSGVAREGKVGIL